MNHQPSTTPPRAGRRRAGWIGLIAAALLGLSGFAFRQLGAQAPAPTPAPTPAPPPVTPAIPPPTPTPTPVPYSPTKPSKEFSGSAEPTPIPITEDPNDPTVSREERFRRQRALLQRRLEEGRRQRAGLPITPAPTPTPAANAAATTATQATTQTATVAVATTATQQSGLAVAEKARIPHATFYLTPASHTVTTGERFATRARLLNPDHLSIDAIHVALKFPEKTIKPVKIHQDRLDQVLAEPPGVRLDQRAGHLIYDAKFKKPLDGQEIELITIEWEGLEPADNLMISPAIGSDLTSAWWGDALVTESAIGFNDALAGARVSVRPKPGAVPQRAKVLAPSLESLQAVLVGLPNQNELRLPTLYIDQPVDRDLAAGEWLVIDLGIQNPDKMAFDEVRLAGRFNPELVELADADKGNWIGEGVNLLDGPFHDTWPWDLHYVNRIDNAAGVFYYRMGMTSFAEQPSGVLARVFARVKRPTRGPLIEWIWDPLAPGDRPATGVYLLAENVFTRGKLQRDPRRAISSTLQGLLPTMPGVEKADPSLYRFPSDAPPPAVSVPGSSTDSSVAPATLPPPDAPATQGADAPPAEPAPMEEQPSPPVAAPADIPAESSPPATPDSSAAPSASLAPAPSSVPADPNAPDISREERFRRQRALLQKRFEDERAKKRATVIGVVPAAKP